MMNTGSARRILIVEDNERNLKLARDVLQFHGFHTLEAETGEDGIAVAREHLPDLILMDIALPGIDGVEATRMLKADAATAAIPVVALTASVTQADRAKFQDSGFAGCIAKPIDVPAFPQQVLQFCVDRSESDG